MFMFSCIDMQTECAVVFWGSCSIYYIERAGLRRLQGSCWGIQSTEFSSRCHHWQGFGIRNYAYVRPNAHMVAILFGLKLRHCCGLSICIAHIDFCVQFCICLHCDGGYRLSPNCVNHQFAGALTTRLCFCQACNPCHKMYACCN